MGLIDRLKNSWDVFMERDKRPAYSWEQLGPSSYFKPDTTPLQKGTEQTIIASIITKIAVDAATLDLKHVMTDGEEAYLYDIDSGLNNCLTCEANIDQTGRAFVQDIVISMLDEGVVAIVPTNADVNLYGDTESFDIIAMRTGKVIEWHPYHVKINLYNERTGNREDIMLPKTKVAIVTNPFYHVMNQSNSTMTRLRHKLALLDVTDEKSASTKLDLIIKLPYAVKNDIKREQANHRVDDIEKQLVGSKYGIAYVDSTENITQLNRSIENKLQEQVEYLTTTLYAQLGINEEILNGSANEETMTNYYSRVIEPILVAITEEMKRKFLSKNARTRGQSIMFFRNPFKLVPVSKVADMADKFTRNELLTSNEMRQIIGKKPSQDPNADALRNKNINQSENIPQYDLNGDLIGGPNQGFEEGEYQDVEEY